MARTGTRRVWVLDFSMTAIAGSGNSFDFLPATLGLLHGQVTGWVTRPEWPVRS